MYITITEQIIPAWQNKAVTHTDYNTGVRGDINVQDMRKGELRTPRKVAITQIS